MRSQPIFHTHVEQTAKKTDYSQGLKLVDLVAETDSLQISEGELSNLKVKDKQEGLKLKFGVMNEADNEIVKFDGKMSDGSALPEWIKINPKTGQTTTNIPEGVDKVEIMIIATDKNNETREIAVEIDPEKIKQDRKIIKQAKRTPIERGTLYNVIQDFSLVDEAAIEA